VAVPAYPAAGAGIDPPRAPRPSRGGRPAVARRRVPLAGPPQDSRRGRPPRPQRPVRVHRPPPAGVPAAGPLPAWRRPGAGSPKRRPRRERSSKPRRIGIRTPRGSRCRTTRGMPCGSGPIRPTANGTRPVGPDHKVAQGGFAQPLSITAEVKWRLALASVAQEFGQVGQDRNRPDLRVGPTPVPATHRPQKLTKVPDAEAAWAWPRSRGSAANRPAVRRLVLRVSLRVALQSGGVTFSCVGRTGRARN
jgi:hypothetical protein